MNNPPAKSSSNPFNTLLNRVMRLLSQRDHSEFELRRKLVQPPFTAKPRFASSLSAEQPVEPIDPAIIEEVITYCYQHNWLDDGRFARSFIASRSRKGYGPQRIRAELMQKGVDKADVTLALADCEIDWCAQARAVAQRKFGDKLPTEWQEKAKVQRYLLYRGFFQEEIQSIYRDFI